MEMKLNRIADGVIDNRRGAFRYVVGPILAQRTDEEKIRLSGLAAKSLENQKCKRKLHDPSPPAPTAIRWLFRNIQHRFLRSFCPFN